MLKSAVLSFSIVSMLGAPNAFAEQKSSSFKSKQSLKDSNSLATPSTYQPVQTQLNQSQIQMPESASNKSPRTDLSESFYQPRAKQVVVNLAPTFRTAAESFTYHYGSEERTGRYDSSSKLLGIGIDLGFTDAIALSFATDYGREEVHTSQNPEVDNGFSNLSFALKANQNISQSDKMIYGMGISLSTENHRGSGNSRDQGNIEGNRMAGGNDYTPMVGYQHQMNNGIILGTSLSYQISGDKETINSWDQSIESKVGGNQTFLTGNVEKRFSRSSLGGEIGHVWMDSNTRSTNNFKTYSDAFNLAYVGAFMSFNAGDQLTIIPNIRYSTAPDRYRFSNGKIDQMDMTAVSVKARMSL